jgi:hypothetical protein
MTLSKDGDMKEGLFNLHLFVPSGCNPLPETCFPISEHNKGLKSKWGPNTRYMTLLELRELKIEPHQKFKKSS